MADEEVIIEIKIVGEDTAKRIGEIASETAKLKKEAKQLKAEEKAGLRSKKDLSVAMLENKAAQKALTEELRGYEKEVKNEIKANKEKEGSLVQLRATLSNLTKEYDSLSKAEREGAKGKELQKSIQETSESLSEAEQSTGRFQRSVGKYPEVFSLASGSMGQFGVMMSKLGVDMQTFSKGGSAGFASIGASVKSFGKLFLTPPMIIVAALFGAIMFVVDQVSKAFKRNDDAGTSLSKMFAAFKPIGQAIAFVFDIIAAALAAVAEAIAWVIGLFSDAAEAAENLVVAQDNLQESERKYVVSSAKNSAKIAELRNEALKDSEYTAEQQKKLLNEAAELQKDNLKKEKAIAKEKLRIAKAQAKQDSDTSDETKDNIAQLTAAVYKADETYISGLRRITSELESFNKEIAAKEKARLDNIEKERKEDVAQAEERAEKLKAITQELEDETRAIIKDATEKAIADEKVSTERRIADLRTRLNTETNLGVEAKKKINALILELEKNSISKIEQIKEDASEAAFQKQINAEQKRVSLLLEVAKEGSYQSTELKLQQIETQRKLEIREANATGDALLLINEKYNNLKTQALATQKKAEYNVLRQAEQNELKAEQIKSLNDEKRLAALELEAAKLEQFNLDKIIADEETKAALYENDANYTAAVLANKERLINAEKAVEQTQLQSVQNQLSAYSSMATSVSDLFNTIAGDNEEMQNFLRGVAVANIGVKTAEGVAGAIAAGSGLLFPANLGAIASGVSAVTSGMAQAVTLLSKAKTEAAPKFAKGGYVSGAGSGTSDSITAKLSNGESVMTALTTSMFTPLISSLNQIGGGNSIGTNNQVAGEDMLARAFAKGVSLLPAPEVSVVEFNNVNARVSTIREISQD